MVGDIYCSTNDEILDQENNADHKNNFDVQRHRCQTTQTISHAIFLYK